MYDCYKPWSGTYYTDKLPLYITIIVCVISLKLIHVGKSKIGTLIIISEVYTAYIQQLKR